ncbi:MAG: DEAD/DEAH box helicase [Verrucomicrobiota bacterium]
MFDEHAKRLLERLPDLPGLSSAECRRTLSAAYTYLIERRLRVANAIEEGDSLIRTRLELRRLADALESVAVFDPLNGVEVKPDVREASAFAAAEAMAILAQLPLAEMPTQEEESVDALRDADNYSCIEAGLLYLIGGYEINAVAAVRTLPVYERRAADGLEEALRQNAAYLVFRLQAFCSGNARAPASGVPYTGFEEAPDDAEEVLRESRLRAYELLATGVDGYLSWLAGRSNSNRDSARDSIVRVQRSVIPENFPQLTALSDLYHLASLILAAIDCTSARSVVHSVPPPTSATPAQLAIFQAYLTSRALGPEGQAGRPFLWPSAKEYVTQCLPGPKGDAVVAMPTGSGKSFVAELGIADALTRGSVIYLAPTNALVHQIRRDLRVALAAFAEVDVIAFLGGGEYSGQFEDLLGTDSTRRFVAVMTPEKCTLALRLTRDAFADLALCVFDECHLLNDDSRGVTADFLMAQLFVAAPKMNFLLMSAMISNPEELAAWLADARKSKAKPSVTKWRPSRTLRGLLALDREMLRERVPVAAEALKKIQEKTKSRKNLKFDVQLALAAGLSGPWTLDGPLDYRVSRLPISIQAHVTFQGKDPAYDVESWKNQAALLFAQGLALAEIPSIAFILSSRHHVFSLGAQIDEVFPGAAGLDGELPALPAAWLAVAEAELGTESALRPLLFRGVAVHQSAMLQTEQAAAEWMFKHGHVKLMLATPTLAQGLNLPAVGVVVAGTLLGGTNAPDADTLPGLASRVDATILNSFGRAGRPGFSNQGIAVLVPDDVCSIKTGFNPAATLAAYPVLRRPDAAVAVQSPIEHYLDRALTSPDEDLAVSDVEWELTTLLAESPEDDDAGEILRRTFAGYRKRAEFTAKAADSLRDRINKLKREFLAEAEIPAWLNLAAAQAGVGVYRAQRLWHSYTLRGQVSREAAASMSVTEWLTCLIETMREMPPYRVQAYMADGLPTKKQAGKKKGGRKAMVTPRTKLRDLADGLLEVDSHPWDVPAGWEECWTEIWALAVGYMQGDTYADLAALYLGHKPEDIESARGTGKPLPAVFAFVRDVLEMLARDAGCFVALNEHALKVDEPEFVLPEALQALPLCIRYGCDSLGVLAWYRFGYRQRHSAHALARAFGVPAVSDDGERARWIAKTRYRWMEGKIETPSGADPVLASVLQILQYNAE